MAIQNIFTGNAANDGTGDTLREAFTKVNSNFLELDSSIDGLANVATSGNYDDLTNKPTLGTAAALDVGTSANSVVQLDIDGKLPAVDGSFLTGISAGGTPGGSDTQIQFNDDGAFGGDSGFTFNKTTKAVTLGGATVTTDAPVLDLSQTWNDAAVTFTGLKLNVTDTASAAGSNLLDLQRGGNVKFSINKAGGIQLGIDSQAVTAIDTPSGIGSALRIGSNTSVVFLKGIFGVAAGYSAASASSQIGFSTDPRLLGPDTILTRKAAANLRFGAADAAAPVAQTLSVQSVSSGTTDTAGANLTIAGSQGTGTGAGGSIVFQVAPAGASGTAQNALATALTINSDRTVSFAGPDRPVTIGSVYGYQTPFGTSDHPFSIGTMLIASITPNGFGVDALIFGRSIGYPTRLTNDGAHLLALRNGTNAQVFRVYNSFTSATSFERAKVAWSSNVLQIGTEKGSAGGTARALELQTDGVTRLTIATDGAATFSSTVTAQNLANGRTLQRFTPLDNQPPATNFATLDTRNSVALLDFDDGATNEEAVFVGVIPESATLTSGIKVRIFWAATTATSGDVEWGAQFEKYGTDIDSDSFDTATFAVTTTSGTSGIVNVTEITCTTIDSLMAGDQFRIKIVRNSSDTTDDTMVGDAELVAVELQQVA
jgi:hypothetical protein